MITIDDPRNRLPQVKVIDTWSDYSGYAELHIDQGDKRIKLSRLMVDQLIGYLMPSKKYHELNLCDPGCIHGPKGHDITTAIEAIVN